jgi:hypothetical protein
LNAILKKAKEDEKKVHESKKRLVNSVMGGVMINRLTEMADKMKRRHVVNKVEVVAHELIPQ